MASPRNLLKSGTVFEKYLIKKELGHGGMGAVYLVEHTILKSDFALKILYPDKAVHDNSFIERFIREARLASRIKHPNLIGVYDVGENRESGVYYIVMEYVKGGSLRDYMKKNTVVPAFTAIKIIYQLASALYTASEFKMVHRDLKPDNVMFDEKGNAKLADLGIAKAADGSTHLTDCARVIGTPAYMSPEQAKDSSTVDERSDIYSLGVVLYEMLCGKNPVKRDTVVATLTEVIGPVAICDMMPLPETVPPVLVELIRNMTAKNVKFRIQSHHELMNRLKETVRRMNMSGQGNETMMLSRNRNTIVAGSSAISGSGGAPSTGIYPSVVTPAQRTSTHRMMRPVSAGSSFRWKRLLITCSVLILLGVFALAGFRIWGRSIQKQWHYYSVRHGLEFQTEPHARIRLQECKNGKVRESAADNRGRVVFSDCPEGEFLISISKEFFQPIEELPLRLPGKFSPPALKRNNELLRITEIPPGSRIVVSSVLLSKPLILNSVHDRAEWRLPAGAEYQITVTNPNYRKFVTTAYLDSARQIEIFPELICGDVEIAVSDSFLTGKNLELIETGTGNRIPLVNRRSGFFRGEKIAPGDYKLQVSAADFEAYSTSFQLERIYLKIQVPKLKRKKVSQLFYFDGESRIELWQQIPDSGEKRIFSRRMVNEQLRKELDMGYIYRIHAVNLLTRQVFEKSFSLKENDERIPEINVDWQNVQFKDLCDITVKLVCSDKLKAFLATHRISCSVNSQPAREIRHFPLVLRSLPRQKTTLRFSGEGIQEHEMTFTPPERGGRELIYQPLPEMAKARIVLNTPSARLEVNGKTVRSGEILNLPPFQYTKVRATMAFLEKELVIPPLGPGKSGTLPQFYLHLDYGTIHYAKNEYSLGLAALKSDRTSAARQYFTSAASRGCLEASYQLGKLAEASGDNEAALRFYKAAERGNISEASLGYARVLRRTGGDPAEIIRHYGRAATRDLGNRQAMVETAVYLEQNGMTSQAKTYWRLAAEYGDPAALVKMGKLLTRDPASDAADKSAGLEFLWRGYLQNIPEAGKLYFDILRSK